jgi:hypothetical protein
MTASATKPRPPVRRLSVHRESRAGGQIALDAVSFCVQVMQRVYAAKSLDEARMVAGEMRPRLRDYVQRLERADDKRAKRG